MGIPAGTNFYGPIQQVGRTTIRTEFATMAYFPLFPVASYYYLEGSEREGDSIPLIYSSTKLTAMAMDKLDWKSVFKGYLPTSCASVGCLCLLSINLLFVNWPIGLLLVGILLALPVIISYVAGKIQIDYESLLIRAIAEGLIGIGVDPKYLATTEKVSLRRLLDDQWIKEGHGDFHIDLIKQYSPRKLMWSLVSLRSYENTSEEVNRLINEISKFLPAEAVKKIKGVEHFGN